MWIGAADGLNTTAIRGVKRLPTVKDGFQEALRAFISEISSRTRESNRVQLRANVCRIVLSQSYSESKSEYETLRRFVYGLQAWHHTSITAKDNERRPYSSLIRNLPASFAISVAMAVQTQASSMSIYLSPWRFWPLSSPASVDFDMDHAGKTWPNLLINSESFKGNKPLILAISDLPRAPHLLVSVQE